MKGVNPKIIFFQLLKETGLPIPETEYMFCPDRLWRADYCWIDHLLILETEGGIWTNGRHNRGSGFIKDIEKYNTMTVLGYRLLRVPTSDLCKNTTLELLKKVIVQ